MSQTTNININKIYACYNIVNIICVVTVPELLKVAYFVYLIERNV